MAVFASGTLGSSVLTLYCAIGAAANFFFSLPQLTSVDDCAFTCNFFQIPGAVFQFRIQVGEFLR